MVPAAKGLDLPPAPPPDPPDPAVSGDSYRCVRGRVKRGVCEADPTVRCKKNLDCDGVGGFCNLGFPRGIALDADDQFGSRHLDVRTPTRLCVPTDVDGEGIQDADTSVMCYRVSTRERTPVRTVQATDRFGPSVLKLRKESELCVPSQITLP
jgi:hypothetical protein